VKIISHRGYWKQASEKNLEVAFRRSFDLGFGTETDVRDYDGKLVISHDMPTGKEMPLEAFLDILDGRPLPLALDIKANGIAKELRATLERYKVSNYFTINTAVVELDVQLKNGLNAFTRMSEVERDPPFYAKCSGVLLDMLESSWYDFSVIERMTNDGKMVCIISCELVGRDAREQWKMLRSNGIMKFKNCLLCTDVPEKAQDYFGGAR
jgi:hypothetical protein